MAHLAAAPARHVTFGATGADYRVAGSGDDAVLVGPHGELAAVTTMRRGLPHDITNGLAAAALVLETGLAGPEAVAAGAGVVHRPAAPHRARRRRRRGALVRRLEGDDPARRVGRHPRVRPRRADRRRAQQGARPGPDGRRRRSGCAPSWRSARPPARSPTTFAGVAPGGHRRLDGRAPSPRPASWRGPATSCCCRPAAPASTGTPTAATRRAATHFRRLVEATDRRRTDEDVRHGGDHRDAGEAQAGVGRRPPPAGARAPAQRHDPRAAGGRAARRSRPPTRPAPAVGRPARPGAGRLLRHRRRRRDVRDARAGDGAVGVGGRRGGARAAARTTSSTARRRGRRSASSG